MRKEVDQAIAKFTAFIVGFSLFNVVLVALCFILIKYW